MLKKTLIGVVRCHYRGVRERKCPGNNFSKPRDLAGSSPAGKRFAESPADGKTEVD